MATPPENQSMDKKHKGHYGVRYPRRTNFLTHKKLQLRFSLIATALIFFSTIGAWLLMQWAMKSSAEGQWWSTVEGINLLHKTNYIIWGVVLADVLAVFLISITFSHSVAGPLFRIEKALTELAETGKTSRINLRKYDMLTDTADLVNRIIDRFGK